MLDILLLLGAYGGEWIGERGEVGRAETGAFGQDVLYERIINENLKKSNKQTKWPTWYFFFDSLIYTYWHVLSCVTTLLGVVIFLW